MQSVVHAAVPSCSNALRDLLLGAKPQRFSRAMSQNIALAAMVLA
jgi:hypothetical protein